MFSNFTFSAFNFGCRFEVKDKMRRKDFHKVALFVARLASINDEQLQPGELTLLTAYRSSRPYKYPKYQKNKESSKMRIKTNVEAGGITMQNNQRITRSLRVKTSVKAGSLNYTKICY